MAMAVYGNDGVYVRIACGCGHADSNGLRADSNAPHGGL